MWVLFLPQILLNHFQLEQVNEPRISSNQKKSSSVSLNTTAAILAAISHELKIYFPNHLLLIAIEEILLEYYFKDHHSFINFFISFSYSPENLHFKFKSGGQLETGLFCSSYSANILKWVLALSLYSGVTAC